MSRVCSICGRVMKDNDTFCTYCGNTLESMKSYGSTQNSLYDDYSSDDTFDTYNYGPGISSLGYTEAERRKSGYGGVDGYGGAGGYVAGGYGTGGYYPGEAGPKADGLAVGSMVCSLVGLVLFFTIITPFIMGIIGTALGGPSIYRISRDPKLSGKGLAVAGVVMGIIDIAIVVGLYFLGRYLETIGYYRYSNYF